MFKWATFREILLPSSGDFKRYFYHWQILERYFSHHQDTSPIIEILLSTFFGHFTSLKTLNIKIFKKFNKTPGDIIILQICAINENHMMCGSWDMECDWENVLSFWTVFCPFTTQKIKILQKWKKKSHKISFYASVPKIMIICYTVPEIRHMTDVIFIFHFGLIFALLPL